MRAMKKAMVLIIIGLFIGTIPQTSTGFFNRGLLFNEYRADDTLSQNRATLILRPNAAGAYNQNHHKDGSPGDIYNYQEVDDISPDDESTYVYDDVFYNPDDQYNIPDHTTETGVIYSVKVIIRMNGTDDGNGVIPSLYINGNLYRASWRYVDFWCYVYSTWMNNPYTGLAWTWDDIDNLQIGFRNDCAKISQVYAEIEYQASTNNPPNTPSNPDPSDHETDVDINTDLSWTGGDPDSGDTVTYDVYFGASSNPPLVSAGQSSTSYDPGTMNQNTMYYWKIIAEDNHGATSESPRWDFTTTGPPNQPPLKPDPPTGPTTINVGEEACFQGQTTDPDDNQIYYMFDWGSGEGNSDWVGPYNSGELEVHVTPGKKQKMSLFV